MMRMIALALAGVIGLMGMVGCEPQEEEPTEPTNGTTGMEDTQPQEPPTGQADQQQPDQQQEPLGIDRSDEEIAREVRNQIQQEAQLDPQGRNITVSVQDGQVTLSGQVQSEQESQQVEQIAADAVGQENVENELEVQDQAQQQPDQQQQQDPLQQQDPQQQP